MHIYYILYICISIYFICKFNIQNVSPILSLNYFSLNLRNYWTRERTASWMFALHTQPSLFPCTTYHLIMISQYNNTEPGESKSSEQRPKKSRMKNKKYFKINTRNYMMILNHP